jgi:ribulose-phosphate 3-epimerase
MENKIAPSILAADFARLGEQVRAVEEAGADLIHVDVMDGHFVPNLSMGPAVVEALRSVTALPLDVHLMITDPERFIDRFVEAGASHITFHLEANGDHRRMAESLRERGIGAGICVSPPTPIDGIFPLIHLFDMALIMTVHPGFGGQSFLAENLGKARAIRAREMGWARERGEKAPSDGERHGDGERRAGGARRRIDVEVDGGIDANTVGAARDAGCNVFVAGSSIFRSPDPGEALRKIRRALDGTNRAGAGDA